MFENWKMAMWWVVYQRNGHKLKHWYGYAKGKLNQVNNFICTSCSKPGTAATPRGEFILHGVPLELLSTFSYLVVVVRDTGWCIDATTLKVWSAWKTFRKLLHILTNRDISFNSCGHVYIAGVYIVMLYAGETWPVMASDGKWWYGHIQERCNHVDKILTHY